MSTLWQEYRLDSKEKFLHFDLIGMKKTCPLHEGVELISTKLSNGKSEDYCPKCQELFGEKI